jgi:hypothetical protein
MSVKPFNFGALHNKLAGLGGSSVPGSHLPSPPVVLDDNNLNPLGRPSKVATGQIGGGAAFGGGGKSMQSPAQHMAVEKAAKVSAAKRRKFL